MTKIYEFSNHLLIYTGYADPHKHRHAAAHVLISADGDMEVTANGEKLICSGVMIPSGVSHTVNTGGSNALVFLYDSTSNEAKNISKVKEIPKDICDTVVGSYFAFDSDKDREEFEKALSKALLINNFVSHSMDERILSAIEYIRSHLSEQITCREVADAVFLSQGRFSHLFRKCVGMTFASFLVYQRLMFSYAEIIKGASITDAAIRAGFSSSAHFADVNRRVFGLSASSITSDLQYIKLH